MTDSRSLSSLLILFTGVPGSAEKTDSADTTRFARSSSRRGRLGFLEVVDAMNRSYVTRCTRVSSSTPRIKKVRR